MKFIKLFIILPFFLFFNFCYAENKFPEKNNSIIKYFCLESVKSEFKVSQIEYKDTVGEDICNCYLKNISNKVSHKESILECKLDNIKK